MSLPSTLRTIGREGFRQCSSLVAVDIPAQTTVPANAFTSCACHVSFYVAGASFDSCPTFSPTTADPTVSPTYLRTGSPTTSNSTISPTTSNPTTAPTTSNPTAAPTSSVPSAAPTTDPCLVHACSADCGGPGSGSVCGWNDESNLCITGETTTQLEQVSRLGDCGDVATDPSSPPGQPPVADATTLAHTTPVITGSDSASENRADDGPGAAVYGALAGVVVVIALVGAVVVYNNQKADRAPAAPVEATWYDSAYPSSAAAFAMTKGANSGHHKRTPQHGTSAQPLPGLVTDTFGKEVDFPHALLSYASNSISEGLGKSYMWALSNVLKDSGITSFNGYMVKAGQNWQLEWYGVLPQSKVVIVMLSREFFKSGACVKELITALSQDKYVIPLFLEDVPLKGNFLGESVTAQKEAAFIKLKGLSANCIPPPDQGHFPGQGAADFLRNAQTLVERIQQITADTPTNAGPAEMPSTEEVGGAVTHMSHSAGQSNSGYLDVGAESFDGFAEFNQ